MASDTQALDDPFGAVETRAGGLVGHAGRGVFAAFAVLGLWALLAPLDSAVIAPGILMSDGRNLVLQHQSGGTIKAIHAHEGEFVEEGDFIVELQPQIDRARLTKLKARRATLLAIKSRLDAENRLDDMAEPEGPEVPSAETARSVAGLRLGVEAASASEDIEDAAFSDIVRQLNLEQEREFSRGRRAVSAQLSALRNRGEAERRRRDGLREQASDTERQLELLETQAKKARRLADAGHLPRREVWDLESRLLQQQSLFSKVSSDAAATERTIAEISSEMDRVTADDARANSEELTKVLSEIEQIRDEIAAAEKALSQTAIVAPTSGYLIRFIANTPGGVVPPGETVGEIVPEGALLVARGRVAAQDIAAIGVGQNAHVQLTALSLRTQDPVPATVRFVAQDATTDERTGERYFEVEAELDLTGRDELNSELSAGMGADIFIKGAARTFASYLTQPLGDAISRSFREP